MNDQGRFETLRWRRYLSLETYRKSGKAVRTPVWFAIAPGDRGAGGGERIYVYTTSDSGKAKRIRNNNTARIARCTALGRVTGPWTDVRVDLVSGEEAKRGMRLINRKYFPIKQLLLDVPSLLSRHQRVVLAIRPN
jgi:PPOX class probable F420-dependent enzyme